VDSAGNAYVTGVTYSTDFPTLNPAQATPGGSWDAFVTKFDPSGSALVYSTYLGGSNDDSGVSIAVDTAGNTYVTGYTSSRNFPAVNAAQKRCNGCYQYVVCNPVCGTANGFDAFVTKINP
jgi:hypothetical protein